MSDSLYKQSLLVVDRGGQHGFEQWFRGAFVLGADASAHYKECQELPIVNRQFLSMAQKCYAFLAPRNKRFLRDQNTTHSSIIERWCSDTLREVIKMLNEEDVLDYADKVASALRDNDLILPEEKSSFARFIRITNR